jgi:DNA polymerase III alpha subunit
VDIDIDLKTDFDPFDFFDNCVRASQVQNGKLVKHNVGVYFQNIPKDPLTGLSAIPYKEAERLGYFKIDMLHLSLLNDFKSKKEIRELVKKEPDWNLLLEDEIIKDLFQLKAHGEMLKKVKPRSVLELGDVMALIRPGKRELLNKYLENRTKIRNLLYAHSDDEQYSFKKGHAISYALCVVLQLHLFKENRDA